MKLHSYCDTKNSMINLINIFFTNNHYYHYLLLPSADVCKVSNMRYVVRTITARMIGCFEWYLAYVRKSYTFIRTFCMKPVTDKLNVNPTVGCRRLRVVVLYSIAAASVRRDLRRRQRRRMTPLLAVGSCLNGFNLVVHNVPKD